MDERDLLLERLRAAGLTEEEIARSEEEGRAGTLAVELALGGLGRHTLTELARAVRLPTPYVREVVQAMGRANPGRGERVFTDEDIEMLALLRRLLDAGVPRRELLDVVRVFGQSTSQMADAVRRAVGDALLRPGDTDYSLGLRYATAAEELRPISPVLLDYGLRTHLRQMVSRTIITEAERRAGRLSPTRDVAVAFADLVGYTRLAGELSAEDVGAVAGRLADLATKAVRPPVRLVKTIGDAAMFVSPEPEPLLDTLVALRDAVAEAADDLPPVRIGVALGPASSRAGDWFGPSVNVASRVTGVARPGQIMATAEVQAAVPERPWKRRRKRALKGVGGRLRLYSLENAADED